MELNEGEIDKHDFHSYLIQNKSRSFSRKKISLTH
jgi:hypothetical protein